jgi:hypothetical protein
MQSLEALSVRRPDRATVSSLARSLIPSSIFRSITSDPGTTGNMLDRCLMVLLRSELMVEVELIRVKAPLPGGGGAFEVAEGRVS